MNLATCSFSKYRPHMGVPVSTAVRPPRNWPYDPKSPSLTPYGIFGKYHDYATYRVHYDDRLRAKQHIIDAELRDLADAYAGQTLVLLCFCDVTKHNGWCHRRMAADWLQSRYTFPVPELTLRPVPTIQIAPPTLFDD